MSPEAKRPRGAAIATVCVALASPLALAAVAAFAAPLLSCVLPSCVKISKTGTADAGADAKAVAIVDAAAPVATAAVDAALSPAAAFERGKTLYGKYCDFCHGKQGEGYAADEAPAIANPEFLRVASDEFLAKTIANGRPGTTMSGWSHGKGGPLSDADVTSLVAFIRGFQARPPEELSAEKVTGDAARGTPVYKKFCESCHGAEGRNGKYIALGGELLAVANDDFLQKSIERGRPGTPMLAFDKLGKTATSDLVALLRTWQKPVEQITELPPRPGALKNVVINPKGPQPNFDAKADFVPVDLVKKEIDRGATVIIADARAPSDYVRAHVVGAISVPFYEVEAYAKQIPKDRYILTYCACPHAVSVKARDTLRKLGYARAAVLDEGIMVWRDRGYGVRGGAKP